MIVEPARPASLLGRRPILMPSSGKVQDFLRFGSVWVQASRGRFRSTGTVSRGFRNASEDLDIGLVVIQNGINLIQSDAIRRNEIRRALPA